ncbi:carotenoid oxygenase family protein [Candidatus Paracaedibacter acanthamoebae]|uniref:Dioxygenase n=1 Tax=Candidatus Odyssella acanthamoebae TaxID=91604 RepID=A0A077AWF8_9PROT|nr:hypothetical protein ID47_08660 [Candidatus Paracaedibacter acanthamoebae]
MYKKFIYIIFQLFIIFITLLQGTTYSYPRLELTEQQQVENKCLPVTYDKIPQWLNGIYIFNGPSHYNLKNQTITHWLDGLAVLYKFDFSEGKILCYC